VADVVTPRVRALIDGALDRVFDEPFDVRTAEELENLVAAGPVGVGAAPAATTLTAFVAAATPMARRAFAMAMKSGKIAGKTPLPSSKAFKVGMASIPIALRLTADRGLVRSLTLSLYLDPARRPVLDIPVGRAAGGVARQWVLRSLGGDAENAVRARARRQAEAIDRLDLADVGREWAKQQRNRPELAS
jgi:hypothetical protein